MTPPTFTDAELLALSGSIERLRDEIATAPTMYENTAAGALAEMDYESLVTAKRVIDRLHRWRKWPSLYTADSYLPTPTLAPASAHCSDCGGYRGGHHAECPNVRAMPASYGVFLLESRGDEDAYLGPFERQDGHLIRYRDPAGRVLAVGVDCVTVAPDAVLQVQS